jgi:hypothetical protein
MASARRFQFRLRTLLIGVSLFAVPLGYVSHQLRFVRERRAVAATLARSHPGPGPSWLRNLLGDEGYWYIEVDPNATDEEVEKCRNIFPEATVARIDTVKDKWEDWPPLEPGYDDEPRNRRALGR